MSDEPPAASPENVPANPDAGATTPTDPQASADLSAAAPVDAAALDAPSAPGVDAAAAESAIDQATIDELLKQASFEDPTTSGGTVEPDLAGAAASGGALPTGEAFELPNFNQVMADAQISSIDLLRDVELNVKIELGRSRMLVEDVLKLGEGSVVELDKLAGDPVDVFVNDRLVARGEVLVLNENFCVRVNEIIAGIKDEGQ